MFGSRASVVKSRITPAHRFCTKVTESNTQARGTAGSLHWMTVLLSLLASLIFVLADADRGRSSESLWIQIAVEVAATAGFTFMEKYQLTLIPKGK